MASLPSVTEYDPVGVICLYRVVLSCGHTFTYETKTNYVPKRMKCPKCNPKPLSASDQVKRLIRRLK